VSFRTRLFVALVLAILIPLGALAYGVRTEMERRLTTEYESRMSSLVSVTTANLEGESQAVATRLRALASELATSDRFRLATVRGEPASRRYLLDYAAGAMKLSGLSLLQVQDSVGRILSSGHFRNEFDRLQPELPRLLTTVGGLALVRTRTPDTTVLALARVDSFQIGRNRFTLVGGTEAERRLIGPASQDGELSVGLDLHTGPAPVRAAGARVLRELPLPYVDLLAPKVEPDTAHLVITQSLGTVEALQRSVDRWFLVALAITVAVALIGAALLSARISRPLRDLAKKTAVIDLDRLDQSFDSDRSDEIGALSRLLGAMTERLRLSSARLREAERRAAVGDLARQVNHDIKNGLVPIRNVLRHLSEVARDDPAALPRIFEERRGTLDSSLAYLDTLARNYARLSPAAQPGACDVNAVVAEIVRATDAAHATLRAAPDPALPVVSADPLVLRRILENLVGNAVDSLAGRSDGVVTVGTEAIGAAESAQVRVTVTDTGPGMSKAELDRAFDDFHTTKAGGTGLGLSIVRRLVLDLGGALRIETAPGAGTRAIVELPVRGAAPAVPTTDGRSG
jgi:signal transduction histidine kinase